MVKTTTVTGREKPKRAFIVGVERGVGGTGVKTTASPGRGVFSIAEKTGEFGSDGSMNQDAAAVCYFTDLVFSSFYKTYHFN